MTFDPTVQQRHETLRAAMDDQISRTSDMDDQPAGHWVVEGVDRYGQIPGPRTGVDHPGDFESTRGGSLDDDHGAIKAGGSPQSADLLLGKRSALGEADEMKSDAGQNDGV